MALLDVKMQLDAAPAKALIQQVGESGRLAEVPLPAALAGEGLGKIRQIRRVVRRNDFRLYPLAVMAEECLLNGFANLLMGNARQEFNQVRYAPAYRGNALGLQLLDRKSVV